MEYSFLFSLFLYILEFLKTTCNWQGQEQVAAIILGEESTIPLSFLLPRVVYSSTLITQI